jgi:hypothetical protein
LFAVWFEALRRENLVFYRPSESDEGVSVDEYERSIAANTIDGMCEASATLCKRLEAKALEAEFEEKQRNNPKNWSDFHQMIEAAESFKEIRNAPVKLISEDFARKTLAQIHGIKPEEVTPELINFEVARLLPFYHRIQLVPSAIQQGSPPAPETKPEVQTDTAQPPPSESSLDPKALRDSYLANFPDERIKIRDLCWAAGQHYREWKRWLAGELKDGSTPDLAFRRVLTSGKRPQELNKKPRPKAWE